jgi:methionyl-tRNA synthetase
MKEPKRYLITAALPYANGPLHIGHIAGAYLNADIYVRYLRSLGKDVAFICGSDEHGAAITLRAKKDGKTPREIVNRYHELMKETFASFGISFDEYHRTSSNEHREMSQSIFRHLLASGAFEVETSQQYYDAEAGQFLADRYIMGTCPSCGNDKAYGDQCERCGTSLSPLELIEPYSTLTGSKPVLKETSHWYLPMAQHEGWVRDFISKGELNGKLHHDPQAWKAHVVGQCMSWIDGGLHSRAMTRDLDWGVPVPVEGADGKVLYVWLDAPIGYITNTKVWADRTGRNWADYWKSDESRLIHFIGKDNIVFHCIIFPIILKAHGGFVLPYNVPANEFMNLEGDKISTSRNWAVWVHEYLQDFPDRQDEMRYVLCSIMPEQKDSEFTWGDFRERVNNELADILGNFVNRVFVLTHKYYEGKIPSTSPSALDERDGQVHRDAAESFAVLGEKLESFRFREALAEAMNIARLGNKYLTETEPWKLVKTDAASTARVLNTCLQLVARLSVALEPFLPFTSKKLKTGLGIETSRWQSPELEAGHVIGTLPILFQKITEEMVEQQVAKLTASKTAGVPASSADPILPNVDFESFQRMEIRVATVLTAEQMPKTKKLLKLTLNTGADQRTVVSGIAEYYSPESLIGKQVLLLTNLAPRVIKGVESQGMILMAADGDGTLKLLSPEGGVNPGSKVS